MVREEKEQLIRSLDLRQNAIKILINSFYGAFGNRYFYFHNNEIAQSITLQGQDLIKFSIKAVNHYFSAKWHIDTELHEKIGIAGRTIHPIEKEAAIYTDTDSVYICFDYAIQSVEGLADELDNEQSLQFCLALNRYRLKDYFKQAFKKYAAHFHTDNRQDFELENISKSAIWLAKKKYILKVSYKDNKQEELLKKESLIIKGLEAIQAAYPIWARNHLYKLYDYFLDIGSSLDLENDLIPKLTEIRDEMESLPIDDIAFNFAVRVYDDYVKKLVPLELEKGISIYARAAAYHNHVIKKSGNQKYNYIQSGSKVRFYYAAPNDYNFDIFAYAPGSYPEEFAPPIDKQQQFFRLIIEPINKLLKAMGYPELTSLLTRNIEIVKSRSRKKDFTDDETYPLYVVHSSTLEYTAIPEVFQSYIGNPDVAIPAELMMQYLSYVSKYGLNTVIVPKHELAKYRDRVAKKLGITVNDPFAKTPEEMSQFLAENGWTEVIEGSWVPTDKFEKALKQGKDYYQLSLFTADAYKKASKAKPKPKAEETA
jgi:hypothetical protein